MTKLTRLTNQNLSQQKQAQSPKVRTALVNSLALGILLICGLTYLGIVNSTAADTFMVYDLNRQIQQTKTANTKLELDISEVLSLPHVQAMSQQYELVAVTDVEYVDANSTVALSN